MMICRSILAASAALALSIAATLAHDVTAAGRYTCTSHEGWKYYYTIHEIEGAEMVYSRGHDNVLTGWETHCHGKTFPIFEYCRDMERLDADASSEHHDRLRDDCAKKGTDNG